MADKELGKKAFEIQEQFRDKSIPDEEIISQIKENPELAYADDLFLEAVFWNRFPIAMVLSEMGADIRQTCKASMFNGNALNVAHSPQQADVLLDMGVEIERNLLLSKPFWNPAIVAAGHNDVEMLFYWLAKQRELFADEPEYVKELFHASVDMVSTMNQYNMLARVMADDELFVILRDIYSGVDDVSSIRLYLGALKYIDDKSLDSRKKELRKILNTRKKELSAKV